MQSQQQRGRRERKKEKRRRKRRERKRKNKRRRKLLYAFLYIVSIFYKNISKYLLYLYYIQKFSVITKTDFIHKYVIHLGCSNQIDATEVERRGGEVTKRGRGEDS